MASTAVATCTACGGAVTADRGVKVVHGTHVEPFCDPACASILTCGVTRAAISLVKPSGPPARESRPARKAAAKPAAQNNEPVRLRERRRQREDDDDGGGDEEGEEAEERPAPRAPSRASAKPSAPRLLLNPGVTPSAAYAAFEARADELFRTNPRSEPIDLSGFDDPPTLDALTGLAAEKLLIHQSTLGIMKVPTLAERSGKRAGNTLFYGPGGTGKSTIMRVMAREAGYALYAPSTSELIDSFQGESARNFRAVFWSAQLMAMAIHERLRSDYSGALLALDEADSILGEVPKGSADPGLGSEFKQHVQSTLANPRFIIVAGTNFPDKITDAAILQRFPIKIYIGTPSDEECIQLVLDTIASMQRKTHPSCRAGQEAKYRALEQAIRTDSNIQPLLVERLSGHTPREINQIINAAMTVPSPLGLAGEYFCPVKDNRTGNITRWDESVALPPGCVRATDLEASLRIDRTVPVCPLVPSPKEFLERALASPVTRSFGLSEMERFRDYARNVLEDGEGVRRLEKLIAVTKSKQKARATPGKSPMQI